MAKWTLVALSLLSLGVVGLAAQVELHLFWAVGCPNCEVMEEFLTGLASAHPELVIVRHEVAYHPDEWRLMQQLAQAYGIEPSETPVVFVGDLATVGIGRAVELRIAEEVERCLAEGCPSPLSRLPEDGTWVPAPFELMLLALAALAVLVVLVQLTSP
jgi:hypothetical protein